MLQNSGVQRDNSEARSALNKRLMDGFRPLVRPGAVGEHASFSVLDLLTKKLAELQDATGREEDQDLLLSATFVSSDQESKGQLERA